MMLGYHLLPPRAVGTSSAARAAAMTGRLRPAARSVTMRRTTSSGRSCGPPRRTPCARFSARASRVR